MCKKENNEIYKTIINLHDNKFLNYLFREAKELFLKDKKLWEKYVSVNIIHENLKEIINKILSERLEFKYILNGNFHLNENREKDSRLEDKVRFLIRKNLNKLNLLARIKKADIFVWTIFIDSLDNRVSHKNFKNVLKTLNNSNLVNNSLVIRFINKSTFLKQKLLDGNKYTVLNIYFPKKYNYGDFLNIVLVLFKLLPPTLQGKSYLWLVDDDSKILNCNKTNNHLDNLLIDLITGRYFVSGECIDERFNISIFHDYVNFPYQRNNI